MLGSGTVEGGALTAGDFVRWCKQLLDLLGQIAKVADPNSPLHQTARAADQALRRGLVAYSAVS